MIGNGWLRALERGATPMRVVHREVSDGTPLVLRADARGRAATRADQPHLRAPMTAVAIHQPHYLPWLGYLAKWAAADVFVFLDTVQYTKNGWQNRNRIKTATGPQWLTVPVHAKLGMGIDAVTVASASPGAPGTVGPSSTPTRARRTWPASRGSSIVSMPSRGSD